jgi:predicted anti-sigma-YlaC factor YlaD
MNVTREVILDLLPVYLSGEASPATSSLVEDYMKQDQDLARQIRERWAENFAKASPSMLPPDLELKSLRRTKKLLGWQRWLFSFGLFFSLIPLSSEMKFAGGRLSEFHFLMRNSPVELSVCLTLAAACWIAYFGMRQKLRKTAL